MSDPRLVTPWDVDRHLVQVILDLHPQHLAAQERRAGLAPRTLEGFRTVTMLEDPGDPRTGHHMWPACLIGTTGADGFVEATPDTRDATLAVAVAVVVAGSDRLDAHHRRSVLAWTALECLVQRAARDGSPITGLTVSRVEFQAPQEHRQGAVLMEASVLLEVAVAEAFTARWLPAIGDTEIPPGDPGGGPEGPYTPPVPAVPVAPFVPDVDKEPVTWT